ncbi:hypothetical protein RRG08_038203 [Elysia crispata]|uniref:Uncharacterized protein n=1 Tax=Elysia crispata TaxID=231223 RepID=A0AAE1E1P8_9GAST|nr:hypothetical protein RRG08_038203 [Elysia crispata]
MNSFLLSRSRQLEGHDTACQHNKSNISLTTVAFWDIIDRVPTWGGPCSYVTIPGWSSVTGGGQVSAWAP